MKWKHAFTITVICGVLLALIYLQFRHWRSFDWQQFWKLAEEVNLWRLLAAIGLIYIGHAMRAVRWQVLLRPTCRTTVRRLLPAQFIGFTGLGLLGRPGELVRPLLIARKENLTFSSQLAVWTVERIFDLAAMAVLMGVTLAIWGAKYRAYPIVQTAGYVFLGIAAVIGILAFLFWSRNKQIAGFFERLLKPRFPRVGEACYRRLCAFGQGLHTIRDFKSFLLIFLLSLGLWIVVANAYLEIMHAYPVATATAQTASREVAHATESFPARTAGLRQIKLEDAVLIMGASVAGSMLQLPVVGGGSQLVVVDLLSYVFSHEPYNITPEIAASCGMLHWLMTFMAVIPVGLILARVEGVSLRKLSHESEAVARGLASDSRRQCPDPSSAGSVSGMH